MSRLALISFLLLGSMCMAGAAAPADDPPREWIEPATGHRVIRLSDQPGTASLYTASGDKNGGVDATGSCNHYTRDAPDPSDLHGRIEPAPHAQPHDRNGDRRARVLQPRWDDLVRPADAEEPGVLARG